MIHWFLREATLTKYFHVPNYDLFKFIAKHIYSRVGLVRVIQRKVTLLRLQFFNDAYFKQSIQIFIDQNRQQLLAIIKQKRNILKQKMLKDIVAKLSKDLSEKYIYLAITNKSKTAYYKVNLDEKMKALNLKK